LLDFATDNPTNGTSTGQTTGPTSSGNQLDINFVISDETVEYGELLRQIREAKRRSTNGLREGTGVLPPRPHSQETGEYLGSGTLNSSQINSMLGSLNTV
jgi:hypothetical protein